MWVRIDDSLAFHPKAIAAGPALALWLRAAAWSAQQLTDGHVPAAMLPALGSRAHAAKLVEAGLWHTDEARGGWTFHQWADHQRSAQEVRNERVARKDRQALVRDPALREAVRKRDKDTCRYCGSKVDFKDRRSAMAGTHDLVLPERGMHVDNVVVACRSCAKLKDRRSPAEAGLALRPAASETHPGPRASLPGSDLDTRRGAYLDQTQVVTPTSPVLSSPVLSSLREEERTGAPGLGRLSVQSPEAARGVAAMRAEVRAAGSRG